MLGSEKVRPPGSLYSFPYVRDTLLVLKRRRHTAIPLRWAL